MFTEYILLLPAHSEQRTVLHNVQQQDRSSADVQLQNTEDHSLLRHSHRGTGLHKGTPAITLYYLFTYLRALACMLACKLTYSLTYLLACLFPYWLAYLRAYLRAYLIALLLVTCLLACLLSYVL